MKRIALYSLRELHLPILLRVYHALKALNNTDEWELGVCAPEFIAGTAEWPEEGLSQNTITNLHHQNIPYWGNKNGHKSRYDAVVTADACYDRVDGWGPVVCVGHGTISKNIFFIDQPICRRENFADILCVPGPWYSHAFGEMVQTIISPTGFPKLDALHEDHISYAHNILAQSGIITTNKKIALYAPTYNVEMCSLHMMKEPLTQLAKSTISPTLVLIKLHGASSQEYRDSYKLLANQNCNILFLEDHDVIPWMQLSDYLISDVSSVYVEYLLLGKPIFLYNHPDLKTCAFYNPKAVEFQTRDACYQFCEGNDFIDLVTDKLVSDPMSITRQKYADTLFPKLDGKNSHRVAQEIEKLLANHLQYPSYRSEFIYVLIEPIHGFTAIELQRIQDNLQNLAFNDKPKVCFISKNKSPIQPSFDFVIWVDMIQIKKLHLNELDGIILLNGEYYFPKELDKLIAMHYKVWQPLAQVQFPLLEDKSSSFYQRQASVLPQRLDATEEKIQTYCKHVYFPDSANIKAAKWDGTFIQHGLIPFWLDYYHSEKIMGEIEFDWFYFHLKLKEQKKHSVCNLGLYGTSQR